MAVDYLELQKRRYTLILFHSCLFGTCLSESSPLILTGHWESGTLRLTVLSNFVCGNLRGLHVDNRGQQTTPIQQPQCAAERMLTCSTHLRNLPECQHIKCMPTFSIPAHEVKHMPIPLTGASSLHNQTTGSMLLSWHARRNDVSPSY